MSNKAYYQKLIIDLRARISREREAMKRDNESYANMIKSAVSASTKASYRKTKISRAESHKKEIARLQTQVAQAQLNKAKATK